MHEIVITDALVLGKRGLGEANQLIALLTRDRGLLYASARSSRVEVSKLRYGLQTLSTGRISMVRGKREWRLTGVERANNDFSNPTVSPARRATAGRVSKLLLRLVAGEEHTPKLFDTATEGFAALASAASDADAQALEWILVLRILAHLGYLPQSPQLNPFIENNLFSLELAAAAARTRSLLIKTINESLGATGL